MNTRVLKEPLGFIRVIEFPMAILAFATCAGYSAVTKIIAQCSQSVSKTYEVYWGYPFGLTSIGISKDICTDADKSYYIFPYGATSQSQFFVFVGVISFLYVLAILAVYLILWSKYENDGRIALADFVFTAIMAALWFIATCAWASGLTAVKSVTDHAEIQRRLNSDGPTPCFNASAATTTPTPTPTSTPAANPCSVPSGWNYASLNVSVIAGFACFALWLANLWFIYKETPWYKARVAMNTPATGPGVGTSSSTSSGGFR